jgi:hydrogenase maturation protein HypF
MPPLLAAGPELKNTFCLTRNNYAFLSHHIGDLENYETLRAFEDGIRHYERLFRIDPQAIAYDLHPDYLATRYAQKRAEEQALPTIGVQHHHAHVAACLAENGHPGDRPVIGLSLDGTGYGEDGAIWGGEILLADYAGFDRLYHLAYVPLPGGDQAIREPWRVALSHLQRAGIPWVEDLPPVHHARQRASDAGDPLDLLQRQIASGLNSPPTSSMGRLFDAVSSLLGVRQAANYEAQAAIELEAFADQDESGAYPFAIEDKLLDPTPMFTALISDLRAGITLPMLSARFHNTIAQLMHQVCQKIRTQTGMSEVALSGGVWQNMILLNKTFRLLDGDGFKVYLHRQVPANDGGVSLGQAVIAMHKLDL